MDTILLPPKVNSLHTIMKLRHPVHTSAPHPSQSQSSLSVTTVLLRPLPLLFLPITGRLTAVLLLDISSHRGKVEAYLRVVRTVVFL
jgi:hypothetical protein